jgi:hypothetical protein
MLEVILSTAPQKTSYISLTRTTAKVSPGFETRIPSPARERETKGSCVNWKGSKNKNKRNKRKKKLEREREKVKKKKTQEEKEWRRVKRGEKELKKEWKRMKNINGEGGEEKKNTFVLEAVMGSPSGCTDEIPGQPGSGKREGAKQGIV